MDQRGLTVVEAVVAILLLTTGVLAVFAGSAGLTRTMAAAARTTRAAEAGHARLETLRLVAQLPGAPCAALMPGESTHAGGLRERWTVQGSGASREVAVAVGPALRVDGDTLRTVISCR